MFVNRGPIYSAFVSLIVYDLEIMKLDFESEMRKPPLRNSWFNKFRTYPYL